MSVKIIVIAGPTAVGKTALGIELAKLVNGEIISGDSQQVYRGLDIGTAKVTLEEQQGVPHHLIDVREAWESYSAYDFVAEARLIISDISDRGKVPIVVGGTGLYLQSLIEGYHLGGNLDQNAVLRYRQELEELTDNQLHDLLDDSCLIIEQFSRRRAIRALELKRFGQGMENQKPDYDVLGICLTDDRDSLYQRINQRVDQMMNQGLLEEARDLYEHHPQVQATRGIGYKELFPYFEGEMTLEEAVELLKRNTRRFAKRQLTWFRNRMTMTFYDISDKDFSKNIQQAVVDFLSS